MKESTKKLLFFIAILIIFVTHGWMIYQGFMGIFMFKAWTFIHVALNLFAGILLIISKVAR